MTPTTTIIIQAQRANLVIMEEAVQQMISAETQQLRRLVTAADATTRRPGANTRRRLKNLRTQLRIVQDTLATLE